MRNLRNYPISAIKRILKSETQDDGADEAGYDAWLETGDDRYLYGDLDDPDELRSEAYNRYLKTGDDAYLYGNNYPKGSRENQVWASVYQPKFDEGYTKNYSTSFNNQNNVGNNQYVNPDQALPEVSNALNTTAPVNGAFSTSNMEQQKLQRTSGDFNSVTSNANPTGENGINTTNNQTSSNTNTTLPDISEFKNDIQSTPTNQLNMNQGVVSSIKKQLEELGKEYERKQSQNTADTSGISTKPMSEKQPMNMEEVKREIEKLPQEMFKSLEVAEDGYIEDDANQLPLSAETETEVERFFQPDAMVEAMDQKSVKIKHLLKSLNSLSESEAIFKDIKNAKKYAKIYNTKIASHNEKAYVVTPTLKDINTFGKRIIKVHIKKY